MGMLSEFFHFLVDVEERTVLGRSAGSWAKITVFYLVYYSCIGAFAYYFIQGYQEKFLDLPGSHDHARPTTQNRVATPGLATYPAQEKIFLDSNRMNMIGYMDELNDQLMSYADSDSETVKAMVSPAKLGPCSPVCVDEDCAATPLFESYNNGHPCIVYSINKVIGWRPFPLMSLNSPMVTPRTEVDDFDVSMISTVVPQYDANNIYIYCYDLDMTKGYVQTDDGEPRFTATFYSTDGEISQSHNVGIIKMSHYPIWEPKDVKSPFVAAQIKIKEQYLGQFINVACQAYAGGLSPNEKQNAAMAVVAVEVEGATESTMNQINDVYHDKEVEE